MTPASRRGFQLALPAPTSADDAEPIEGGLQFVGLTQTATPEGIFRSPEGEVTHCSLERTTHLLAGPPDPDGRPTGSDRSPIRTELLLDTVLSDVPAAAAERLGMNLALTSLVRDGWPRVHPGLGDPLLLTRAELAAFQAAGSSRPARIDAVLDMAAQGRLRLRNGRGRGGLLPVSRATLYRHLVQYEEQGLVGLMDKRRVDSVRRWADPDVHLIVTCVSRYASEEAPGSTRITKAHRTRCSIYLDKHLGRGWRRLPDRFMDAIMKKVFREYSLHLPYRLRQSRSVSNPTGMPGNPVTGPRQVLQIDITGLKMDCQDVNGQLLPRVDVVSVIDRWNSELVALDLVPGTASAEDVGAVFASVLLRGVAWGQDSPPSLMGMPHAVAISDEVPDCQAISEFLTDRGTNIIAAHNLAPLAWCGTSVALAPPGRGDVKGVVEAVIRAINRSQHFLAGFRGRDPSERGRRVPQQPLIRFDDVVLLLQAWAYFIHNDRPHSGLRLWGSSITVSPYDLLEAYVELFGLPSRSIRFDDVKAFMTVEQRVVGPHGVEVDGEYYRDVSGLLLSLSGVTRS